MKNQVKKLSMILQEKSARALANARKNIQQEQLKSKQARDALSYYVENWHYIIHPGLISLSAEATQANSNAIVQAQTAMLFLSAAFDIHDDIIDQSSIKNGKPTLFGKFGNDIALLIGNAFFVKGFTALHDLANFIPRANANEIFSIVQKAFFRMGDAHALEVEMRHREDVSLDDYWCMVDMKASAIQADFEIGALLGKATKGEIEAFSIYGHAIGELEILRDDFIDIFETEELLNRFENECPPIPILYAFQDSKTKSKIHGIIRKNMSSEDADLIVDIIFNTKGVTKLRNEMQNLVDEATQALKRIRESATKSLLSTLAKCMLEDLER